MPSKTPFTLLLVARNLGEDLAIESLQRSGPYQVKCIPKLYSLEEIHRENIMIYTKPLNNASAETIVYVNKSKEFPRNQIINEVTTQKC